MHRWFWCFTFLAEINFTGAVVTCRFPSLVIPFLNRRQRYRDDLFKLQPSLFKASVSWSKVLTVRMISDPRLLWTVEPEIAFREIAEINSSLSAYFSSSYCNFFKSFAPVCSLIAWTLRFWFTRNFYCRLRAASFCFRFVWYFLSVVSLDLIFLRSLCESCPRSLFRYKPTSISFLVLIFCLASSWAGVWAAVLMIKGGVSVEGLRLLLSLIVTLSVVSWLIVEWFFFLYSFWWKLSHFRFFCKW